MVTGVRRQSGHCSDSCLEKLCGQGAPGQHRGADLEARSGAHLVIESNICLVHSEGSRPCSYTSVASDVSTNLRITRVTRKHEAQKRIEAIRDVWRQQKKRAGLSEKNCAFSPQEKYTENVDKAFRSSLNILKSARYKNTSVLINFICHLDWAMGHPGSE